MDWAAIKIVMPNFLSYIEPGCQKTEFSEANILSYFVVSFFTRHFDKSLGICPSPCAEFKNFLSEKETELNRLCPLDGNS